MSGPISLGNGMYIDPVTGQLVSNPSATGSAAAPDTTQAGMLTDALNPAQMSQALTAQAAPSPELLPANVALPGGVSGMGGSAPTTADGKPWSPRVPAWMTKAADATTSVLPWVPANPEASLANAESAGPAAVDRGVSAVKAALPAWMPTNTSGSQAAPAPAPSPPAAPSPSPNMSAGSGELPPGSPEQEPAGSAASDLDTVVGRLRAAQALQESQGAVQGAPAPAPAQTPQVVAAPAQAPANPSPQGNPATPGVNPWLADKGDGHDTTSNYVAKVMGFVNSGMPIKQAVMQVESSGGTDNRTSDKGAVGPMQITPDTWAQYAKPGENINNKDDNIAVGNRVIDDLSAKFGGDPAKIAVAYFSGPGNVNVNGIPSVPPVGRMAQQAPAGTGVPQGPPAQSTQDQRYDPLAALRGFNPTSTPGDRLMALGAGLLSPGTPSQKMANGMQSQVQMGAQDRASTVDAAKAMGTLAVEQNKATAMSSFQPAVGPGSVRTNPDGSQDQLYKSAFGATEWRPVGGLTARGVTAGQADQRIGQTEQRIGLQQGRLNLATAIANGENISGKAFATDGMKSNQTGFNELEQDGEKAGQRLAAMTNLQQSINTSGAGPGIVQKFKRSLASLIGVPVEGADPTSMQLSAALVSQNQANAAQAMKGLGLRTQNEFNTFVKGVGAIDTDPDVLKTLLAPSIRHTQYDANMYQDWHNMGEAAQQAVLRNPYGMSAWRSKYINAETADNGVQSGGPVTPTAAQVGGKWTNQPTGTSGTTSTGVKWSVTPPT